MTEEEKAKQYAMEGWEKSLDLRVVATPVINKDKYEAYLAGLHEGRKETDYAKSIIKSLLDNSDEYAEQRARDFLKE